VNRNIEHYHSMPEGAVLRQFRLREGGERRDRNDKVFLIAVLKL